MMFRKLGTDEVRTQRFERRERAVLVRPDQAGVADHVSGHDGGEAAFHADYLLVDRVENRWPRIHEGVLPRIPGVAPTRLEVRADLHIGGTHTGRIW